MNMVLSRAAATLLIFSVVMPTAGSAAPPIPSTHEIISALKRSDLPLTKGADDCPGLAKHYPTLGALVVAHDKVANRERIAACHRGSGSKLLACRAQFSNGVPPERSEEEFTLVLEFQLKGQRISNLKCFLAA
jgi:hypothetical protein